MTEQTYYGSISAAEKAITDAGYVRDREKHVWVNASKKRAKVVREEPGKFYVDGL